jgi:PKD repeat protein
VNRHLITRAFSWIAASALAGGCTLSDQQAPALAGPSELALSLAATATPDVLTQDGRSQAILTVVTRGAGGQPVGGVSLRLAMFVGGVNQDYGTLSSKSISTDDSGYAFATYTAPSAPPVTVTEDRTVSIEVLPVGDDFGNSTPRSVSIRLARGGVILPPQAPPLANFAFSPSQPHENERVQFDASSSASAGTIVSYDWKFGDGSSASGTSPVQSHTYGVAGTDNVVLTVTDDRGQRTSGALPVVVAAATNPTAAFDVSPAPGPAAGEPVFLDASASTVSSGRSIVGYAWNFGDGSAGAGRTTSHIYSRAATYTVVLTVTDSTGRIGVSSKTVQVK